MAAPYLKLQLDVGILGDLWGNLSDHSIIPGSSKWSPHPCPGPSPDLETSWKIYMPDPRSNSPRSENLHPSLIENIETLDFYLSKLFRNDEEMEGFTCVKNGWLHCTEYNFDPTGNTHVPPITSVSVYCSVRLQQDGIYFPTSTWISLLPT